MLQIKNLKKIYLGGRARKTLVLDDINLQVNAKEIYGVIGKSGAGKSTLIRCVNLLEKPTQGSVLFDGVDLTKLKEKQLRKERLKISMIFQAFNLLSSRTVYENILLPLEFADIKINKFYENKACELLKLVGLSERKNFYPDELSGGQKQRAAIARALITEPKLLLCDEPTSSLDQEATNNVLVLLKEINKIFGVTILIITHQMHVIKTICDRVAVIDHGKLVEEGDVVTIFTNPKSAITKNLTRSVLHLELPNYLQSKLHKNFQAGLQPIAQLTFIGNSANEPIIANISKKFAVSISILQADLESIHGATLGFLICKFFGTDENITATIKFLEAEKIKVEVIGYV